MSLLERVQGKVDALAVQPENRSAGAKVRLITSEKIGKDLFRQVHLIQFSVKTGEKLSAITVNEVSSQECSMSNVDVYLVSRQLGNYSGNK